MRLTYFGRLVVLLQFHLLLEISSSSDAQSFNAVRLLLSEDLEDGYLSPTGEPTSVPTGEPTAVTLSEPTILPTAEPYALIGISSIPTIGPSSNVTYSDAVDCSMPLPSCDASTSSCKSYSFEIQQIILGTNVETAQTGASIFYCVVANVAGISSESIVAGIISTSTSSRRDSLNEASESVIFTYQIELIPESYGFSDPQLAYDNIVGALNSTVASGSFTYRMNSLAAATSEKALAYPAASNSIEFFALTEVEVATVSPTSRENIVLSGQEQGKRSFSSSNAMWYMIYAACGFAVLSIACIAFFYCHRRYNKGSDKLEHVSRATKADQHFHSDGVVPVDGEPVEWYDESSHGRRNSAFYYL